MLDALHITLISIIFFLILYVIHLYNLEKLTHVNIKKNFENNVDSETDIDLPFGNKPIVVYKMEYRNRNLTL